VADFLDKETKASSIKLHQEDARNEIMNMDLLLPSNSTFQEDYSTPEEVA